MSRRKIAPETHLKAVKAYLAEKGSYSSIAKKYGIGMVSGTFWPDWFLELAK